MARGGGHDFLNVIPTFLCPFSVHCRQSMKECSHRQQYQALFCSTSLLEKTQRDYGLYPESIIWMKQDFRCQTSEVNSIEEKEQKRGEEQAERRGEENYS